MVFRVTVVVNRRKLWNFLLATKCRNCRRTVKDRCPIVSEGEVWKAAVACFRASCLCRTSASNQAFAKVSDRFRRKRGGCGLNDFEHVVDFTIEIPGVKNRSAGVFDVRIVC